MALKSADSEWADVVAFAQSLLDRHVEARDLIDEARRRRDVALDARGDLASWPWETVRSWRLDDRFVADYRAAVRHAANLLVIGHSGEVMVHDLVGRRGYKLHGRLTHRGPVPAVASKIAAAVTLAPWGAGATANRQSAYRYIRTFRL